MNTLYLLEVDCEFDESSREIALSKLPPAIVERALRYRVHGARNTLLGSQIALRRLLDIFAIPHHQLKRCPQGRPFLEDTPLEFNLSHSENRAVIAFAWDRHLEGALGVDIEWSLRRVEREALAKRFFTPEEFDFARHGPEPFFKIWTRKEAVLKSNGVGLRVPLDSFQVLNDTVAQEVTGVPLVLGTAIRPNGYLISWAVPESWGEYEIRWLQEEDLARPEQLLEGIAE